MPIPTRAARSKASSTRTCERRRTHGFARSIPPGIHSPIADIPLLFETGGDRDYDAVIVTACDPATQVRRIMERDPVTDAEARQRLAAQLPIEEKVRRADYVIRTDGTFEETDRQVRDVLTRKPVGRYTGSVGSSSAVGESFAGASRSSTNVFHSWHCGHCQSSSVLR